MSFGCSSLVWFCVMMGNECAWPPAPCPHLKTPTGWGPSRLSLSRPLPGALVLPHLLRRCTILCPGRKTSPHPTGPSDSGCLAQQPLAWRPSCRPLWLRADPGPGTASLRGFSRSNEQNAIGVEPASVSSLMHVCVTFRAWS